MIYLTNGNMPLNAAYADEIVQEDNSTYQLSFRFPTSDSLWEKLKEETFLTADDLHGEQDFVIFEVEKKHGYIQVYANQVFTLLNNYVVNPISLDRQTGSTALSRFAGSITRDNPFSFFSDIEDRHTFNIGSKNAMEAFAKDKHSIIGQWGGDLVRHGYQVRLLKKGGSENESLFMYKKNLSSYQHKTSTKSLKTRITFIATVKGEGEKAPDRTFTVTIDSPLINKYSQIYEDVIEVNDQDVKDEASLRKYGEQYYRTSLCDMMEDSLEIEVVGQSDVPVQMFDIVSIFHERYNLDLRKKITKYTYSPMAKKLKSIGFGQFQSGLANAIGNAVSDAVKDEAQQLQGNFERQLARELKNADLAFDRKTEELQNEFEDGLNATRAKAEEVKRELSDTINQRFNSFDNGPLQEVKRRAEEALRNAGASSLLAQEAKRIGLDSVAKLEAFKRQATSAQTALSGDLDALKRTIANDIRPKQAHVETEIAKQVEALNKTKNELAGVKSAQATYEETTTRRLAELTNLANGKASKSELTQTAEELASKIASVQVAHRNQGDRVSAIESNFKQRADSLDAGVSRLTEGLRSKADISSLNVTAENIRQSVKSLETNTQNKLNQKLSTAEFEVRAGSIRQEILNATKDKADKTLVVAEAGKLREEFSKMKVGSRNYAEDYDFSRGLWHYSQGDNSPQDWTISNGEYNVKGTTNTWKQMQIHSKEGSRSSWKSSTALLDLEVGETYTLSFQGICYSGSSSVWLSLRANRTVSGNPEIIPGTFNLTSSWQTYQVTIPALTKPDNFDFWRIILGYDGIGHVAFRKVELTRSSTRIDAGPASEDGKTDLVVAKSEFQKTAEGLRTDLSAIQEYVNKDGQRQEALQRYTREESAKQATAVRELVAKDYVGKATYQEDVRGINQRIEEAKKNASNELTTRLANYRQTVDGKFTDISSQVTTYKQVTDEKFGNLSNQIVNNKNSTDDQIENVRNQLAKKVEVTDFQRVQETSRLYERIIGSNENDITDKVARMALTNQLFQVEVAKRLGSDNNLIVRSKSMDRHTLVNEGDTKRVFVNNGIFTIRCTGNSDYTFAGFTLPLYIDRLARGETYTLNFKYRIMGRLDHNFTVVAKNHQSNEGIFSSNIATSSTAVSSDWKEFNETYTISRDFEFGNSKLYPLYFYLAKNGWVEIKEIMLVRAIQTNGYKVSQLDDMSEAVRSVQTQLAGSWAVQNINSAGSIVSQINATNNQILIEAEKIRLKGKTLLDELMAIQGYFKRLFVGDANVGTLNSDIIRANSITADKLVMDIAMARRFVSSDIFTDTLAAKEAFINKLRSVVVTATLLEGYRGLIGGFQIGTHEKDSSVYWITGQNQFSVGMSNGSGHWSQTALWVNWGNDWGYPGDYAWYVKNNGKMYCYNTAEFWNTPVIHGNLRVTGHIYYNNENSGKTGYWIHSSKYSNFEPSDNYLYLYYSGSGYDWIPMNKEISDRRYKSNIEASTVSGLDVVESLKTYSYRKEYDGKIEDISCGIMAQDVQKYAPEAFFENPDGAYSYNTFALVPYLIKAIQELNHKIEKLEKTA
ncbi:phage tail spike protein [Streptococcus infantis]|uniref:phage tail spike protein n=1 Tax=Streptococcus infantis TaxID=68892 RepID=UPI0039C1D5ED